MMEVKPLNVEPSLGPHLPLILEDSMPLAKAAPQIGEPTPHLPQECKSLRHEESQPMVTLPLAVICKVRESI